MAEDFEQFCFALLDFEVSIRHVEGRADPPPSKYVGDEGMDLAVYVSRPPRISREAFLHALTEDAAGTTCVACKSGHTWSAEARRDIKKKPAPLEVVGTGGHYTLLVNQKVSAERTKKELDFISGQLAKRAGISLEEARDRVHLYDADDLAAFLAHHWIGLDPQTQRQLGMDPLPGLLIFDEWREVLAERSLPDYTPDRARTEALDQLSTLLARDASGGSPEVAWMYGPPGAGKSRLVFESIRRSPGAQHRVLAAAAFEIGRRAIEELQVPSLPDIILVVDECPPADCQRLASLFIAQSRGNNSTLLLIGPQDASGGTSIAVGRSLEVKPLEREAGLRLAEQELDVGPGEEEEVVKRVMSLSEGFPWFTILLARALRENRAALPEDATQWNAAQLAIAGPPPREEALRHGWEREIVRRSKALLAILLTEGLDWRHLEEDQKQRLGKALGLSWDEILEAAVVCRNRGIVRERLNWRYRYVTPNNLGRLVADKHLRPPHDLGQQLRRQVPELLASLYGRLEALEVDRDLLAALADEEIRRFQQEGPTKPNVSWHTLAKWRPSATARQLRLLIEATPLEVLRADTVSRRDWVWALEHICRRRSGFEDAEAALFRLALAENETWSNNATGIWTSLFLVAMSLTHEPFEPRLAILRERLLAGDSETRLLSLAALKRGVSNEHVGPSYTDADKVDGEWLMPTRKEYQAGKRACWDLLLQLTAHADGVVASKARQVAIEELRDAVWLGIGTQAMSRLITQVSNWSDQDRGKLRGELDEIRRYDQKRLTGDPELRDSIDKLGAAAAPRTFHDRLMDAVGRWFPGTKDITHEEHEIQTEALDRTLAIEGIGEGIPLVQSLAWLDSQEAVRAVPFMTQVGMLDNRRVMVEPLVERATGGGALNTLPAYLWGMARAGAEQEVQELLRRRRDDRRLSLHTLYAVARVGSNNERMAWIADDVRSGRLSPESTGVLRWGSWGTDGSTSAAMKLLDALTETENVIAQLTALDLILSRIAARRDKGKVLEERLLVLIDRLSGKELPSAFDLSWVRACKVAIQKGHAELVARAVIETLRAEHGYSRSEAWGILAEAASRDAKAVWGAIADVLEARDSAVFRLSLSMSHSDLLSLIPSALILSWVGDNPRRSMLVAALCTAHEAPLNELARKLIIRFGPDSSAARELIARAHSTPGAVWGGLSVFAKAQLENAKAWAQDGDPNVATWGRTRVKEFEADLERELAREEFEERHGF